jgi:hypothetical protein
MIVESQIVGYCSIIAPQSHRFGPSERGMTCCNSLLNLLSAYSKQRGENEGSYVSAAQNPLNLSLHHLLRHLARYNHEDRPVNAPSIDSFHPRCETK